MSADPKEHMKPDVNPTAPKPVQDNPARYYQITDTHERKTWLDIENIAENITADQVVYLLSHLPIDVLREVKNRLDEVIKAHQG